MRLSRKCLVPGLMLSIKPGTRHSACESAATSLWPGCRLPPEEQSATAGLVRSNLTRPLVVHETTHPLHAGAPTTLVRQMGARHGSFTGLSRA